MLTSGHTRYRHVPATDHENTEKKGIIPMFMKGGNNRAEEVIILKINYRLDILAVLK